LQISRLVFFFNLKSQKRTVSQRLIKLLEGRVW
jgi:hypothetical protein